MPVTKTSVFGDRSLSFGGSRWIGQRSVAPTGPRPSIGSPSRLNTRESVSFPTGTVTGSPRSTTSIPRTIPSVPPNATHRTRPPAEVLLDLPGDVDLDPVVSSP